MRTLMLLVLTVVAVAGLKQHEIEEFLLREIIESVDLMLNQSSKMNLRRFVEDVFSSAGCSKKQLCQAAQVIKTTYLNDSRLQRRLTAYANTTKHLHCSVTASEQHRMGDFLKKIKECSQQVNSKPNPTKHANGSGNTP